MVSPKTRAIIWARAAGRCQYPGCNSALIGDLVSGNEDGNFGFIAHIVADSVKGPRGDVIRSPQLADDPDNLMLLCATHHKLIDVDEKELHPESRLLSMKAAHERRIEIVTGLTDDLSTLVVRYGAKIGSHESLVSFEKVRTAVLPNRYPAGGQSVGIEILGNPTVDGDDSYWAIESQKLQQDFEIQVRPQIAGRRATHLSVFAAAPMPLLIKLGTLLGDITPIDVYQLHREPAGWHWAENGPRATFKLDTPNNKAAVVALKIGISAPIDNARIHAVLGEDVEIWSLSVQSPGNDVMRYRADLSEFRAIMRRTYADILKATGPDTVIHVFPAMPISTAIEMGRVRMPKVDRPLQIYDALPGRGFVARLNVA